jgi:uncharacterized protein
MASGRAIFRCLVIALAVAMPLAAALPAGAAAPKFPALTGRVVDDAGVLSESTRARLSQTLEAFERDTKRQLVVATIADLQGYAIDDYGYQLGRHWGIGEKGKDSGAILLVAPKERQVRIEVGYGLEGELTDAVSRRIIEQDILPQFRAGSFDAGVTNGTLAILRALGWQGAGPAPQRAAARDDQQSLVGFLLPFGMFLLFMFLTNRMGRRRGPWGRVYRGGGPFGRGGFGPGGFGGRGSGGGGFRGGGGSFGGGGASGRW